MVSGWNYSLSGDESNVSSQFGTIAPSQGSKMSGKIRQEKQKQLYNNQHYASNTVTSSPLLIASNTPSIHSTSSSTSSGPVPLPSPTPPLAPPTDHNPYKLPSSSQSGDNLFPLGLPAPQPQQRHRNPSVTSILSTATARMVTPQSNQAHSPSNSSISSSVSSLSSSSSIGAPVNKASTRQNVADLDGLTYQTLFLDAIKSTSQSDKATASALSSVSQAIQQAPPRAMKKLISSLVQSLFKYSISISSTSKKIGLIAKVVIKMMLFVNSYCPPFKMQIPLCY